MAKCIIALISILNTSQLTYTTVHPLEQINLTLLLIALYMESGYLGLQTDVCNGLGHPKQFELH